MQIGKQHLEEEHFLEDENCAAEAIQGFVRLSLSLSC